METSYGISMTVLETSECAGEISGGAEEVLGCGSGDRVLFLELAGVVGLKKDVMDDCLNCDRCWVMMTLSRNSLR